MWSVLSKVLCGLGKSVYFAVVGWVLFCWWQLGRVSWSCCLAGSLTSSIIFCLLLLLSIIDRSVLKSPRIVDLYIFLCSVLSFFAFCLLKCPHPHPHAIAPWGAGSQVQAVREKKKKEKQKTKRRSRLACVLAASPHLDLSPWSARRVLRELLSVLSWVWVVISGERGHSGPGGFWAYLPLGLEFPLLSWPEAPCLTGLHWGLLSGSLSLSPTGLGVPFPL